MEAVSLVASIVNIVDGTTKCIRILKTLQLRLQTANLTLTALTSQLGMFKAALDQIRDWMLSDSESIAHYQLSLDLDFTLKCSRDIIQFVDGFLTQLLRDEGRLTFRGKAMVALDDDRMRTCVDYLNSQSIALSLLLTALNRYCPLRSIIRSATWSTK